jgi:hypothetical protein
VIIVVLIICAVLGVGVYYGLTYSGILPDSPPRPGRSEHRAAPPSPSPGFRTTRQESWTDGGSGLFGIFPRVPHLRELPQGCLIALIIAATLWFVAWTVVLVLAFGILNSAT